MKSLHTSPGFGLKSTGLHRLPKPTCHLASPVSSCFSLYPKPCGLGHDHSTPGPLLLLSSLPFKAQHKCSLPLEDFFPTPPLPCPAPTPCFFPWVTSKNCICVCPCGPVANFASLSCKPRDDRDLSGCLLWDPAAQGRPVELLSECVRQTEPSSPGREIGLLLAPGLEHHFFGPLWRSLSLQSD